MLTAKDIMTKNVVSVQKDAPVCEAIELMLNNRVAGMPVVREDMTLMGIITEKDVLRLYDSLEDAEGKRVEDFMTTPAVHFGADETLADICYCLINNDFRRVPVTSGGKVVGVVSRPDVVAAILELARGRAAHASK